MNIDGINAGRGVKRGSDLLTYVRSAAGRRPALESLQRLLDRRARLAEGEPQVRGGVARLAVAVEGRQRDRDHPGLLGEALGQGAGVGLALLRGAGLCSRGLRRSLFPAGSRAFPCQPSLP